MAAYSCIKIIKELGLPVSNVFVSLPEQTKNQVEMCGTVTSKQKKCWTLVSHQTQHSQSSMVKKEILSLHFMIFPGSCRRRLPILSFDAGLRGKHGSSRCACGNRCSKCWWSSWSLLAYVAANPAEGSAQVLDRKVILDVAGKSAHDLLQIKERLHT